jgi:hypothetical protein
MVTVKTLIGIALGVFLFFLIAIFFSKWNVIDFIKGLPGGKEPDNGAGVNREPSRLCEDCGKGMISFFFCDEKECSKISNELKEFDMRCQFCPKSSENEQNKCLTLDKNEEDKVC